MVMDSVAISAPAVAALFLSRVVCVSNQRQFQPFAVVLLDGRHASNRPLMLPPTFERGVAERVRRSLGGQDGPGRRGGPRSPAEYAPIVVNMCVTEAKLTK